VDATIIAAASSTKNASAIRDPEMKQTRKGRNWFFGMKLHVGTDQRGIVHTVRATAASVADITQLPELLHGQEREVFGDQAHWKEDDREFLEAWGMRYRINRRPTSKQPLSERWRMINRARSRTRARGEHAFRVVKRLWGFAKVRYRGLAKNLARAQSMFALANLYQSSQTTASKRGQVCAVKNLRAVSRPYRAHCRANPHRERGSLTRSS
jgi:transposase, IS5 family